jgi:hypothetical protein
MLYLGNYLSCQVEEQKVSVNMETEQINNDALQHKLRTITSHSPLSSSSGLFQLFNNIKALYATALGIEILCIAAAK